VIISGYGHRSNIVSRAAKPSADPKKAKIKVKYPEGDKKSNRLSKTMHSHSQGALAEKTPLKKAKITLEEE
jgi:hypothetical protein